MESLTEKLFVVGLLDWFTGAGRLARRLKLSQAKTERRAVVRVDPRIFPYMP